jgi:hypothetical protein
MQNKRVNCYQCKHFYVTWDPKFPRGCRAFAFKSASLPFVVVIETEKERIQSFPENILYIQGDATEDKVLIEAGIERCGTKEQLAMFEKEAVL